MSFDPENVTRYGHGEFSYIFGPRKDGYYVSYDDYAQLLSLLHEVSTDADPAGTVRELAVARETIKAQEVLIQELRAEVKKLRGEGQ
jgi:hypothetical protein